MMKSKLLALAVVLALCSGCQSESTGSANLPQYENLIFRRDVEKAQPEETKQKEKTVLPQNLKQALNDYCRVLDQAKKELEELVGARTGDKTLMDTLTPAVAALEKAGQEGADMQTALVQMKKAAESGRDSTKDMIAKFGRASRLGERSRGVLDAGAVSCCILLQSFADGIMEVIV